MSKQLQIVSQKQNLAMTASMHQSINILQMSSYDLIAFATEVVEDNPCLEDNSTNLSGQGAEYLRKKEDINYLNSIIKTKNYVGSDNSHHEFLTNIPKEITLKDHLEEQINLLVDDAKEKMIANYLLNALMSSGYLQVPISEVSDHFKCSDYMVEEVLIKIQKCEPLGVFARNLSECLKLQAVEASWFDAVTLKLINNIQLVATKNASYLAKFCNCSVKKIKQSLACIKSLNPKPATGFASEQISYKIPDVIMNIDDNNNFELEINYEAMPSLRVNDDLKAFIKGGVICEDDKSYIKNAIESASNICKGLKQRANTILKVASAIVQEQNDFFTRGVMYLKPLTLSEIALVAGYNESTVSRATANKYIATPGGIYELKYFFSSAISSNYSNLDDISSTKVKEVIKQLISCEEDNILSDHNIAEQLKKFNINIARRTVAKYRESMAIPTSAIRKRKISLL